MLVLKGLIQYYKNDRKDFILSCLFMSALLVFVVGGMIGAFGSKYQIPRIKHIFVRFEVSCLNFSLSPKAQQSLA